MKSKCRNVFCRPCLLKFSKEVVGLEVIITETNLIWAKFLLKMPIFGNYGTVFRILSKIIANLPYVLVICGYYDTLFKLPKKQLISLVTSVNQNADFSVVKRVWKLAL
jgi:hypothetical protein